MDDFFLKALESKLKEVSKSNKAYVTYFLTLEEQAYLHDLERYYPDLTFSYEGLILNAERKVCLIYSEYQVDYNICLLKLTYNNKFKDINHRMILGSLMSLGLERNRVGDIVIKDGYSIIAVSKNLSEFIMDNLKTVGRVSVEVSPFEGLIEATDDGVLKTTYVSSLRVDNVISSAFNLNREKASSLIFEEFVKINQKVVFKAFQNVKACDIISVAHFGRIKILNCDHLTKSGRIVLEVKIYR